MKTTPILYLSAVCLCLSNCKDKPADASNNTTKPAAIALDAFFAAKPPASAGEIHAIRATAKPGDTVALTGLVMGRDQPFVDGRAAFVLGDRSILTPCNEKPGDNCETPWDTCCNTPEEKQRATATIQLLGPDGRVLKQGLKGTHGLTELSAVTLTGTVDKASTPEALIINATQLHVATR